MHGCTAVDRTDAVHAGYDIATNRDLSHRPDERITHMGGTTCFQHLLSPNGISAGAVPAPAAVWANPTQVNTTHHLWGERYVER